MLISKSEFLFIAIAWRLQVRTRKTILTHSNSGALKKVAYTKSEFFAWLVFQSRLKLLLICMDVCMSRSGSNQTEPLSIEFSTSIHEAEVCFQDKRAKGRRKDKLKMLQKSFVCIW